MHEDDIKTKLRSERYDNTTWVDVENPDDEAFAKLQQLYRLDPVHLNESTQKVQHTQVEREENYLFFVLHFPVLEAQDGKILIKQVGIFLGRDFVVTIRSGDCLPLTKTFELCQQHTDKKEANFKQGSSYLLYVLVSKLLDDISDMTENVVSELDDIEDLVFDNNTSDAQRIGRARQKIVRLSRVIGPKRIILKDLAEQIDSFSGKSLSKYYSNNTKTSNRLWEVIEEAKETVEIYKDADFTTSTEQTNKILAVLTLVFTFTIPISVMGTIYGMNVPLPGGVTASAWTFLGRFTTFEVLLALSVASAFAMYVYFKRKKWF
jgi:magnesium transporter